MIKKISKVIVHNEIISVLLVHKDEEDKIKITKILFINFLAKKMCSWMFHAPRRVSTEHNIIPLF